MPIPTMSNRSPRPPPRGSMSSSSSSNSEEKTIVDGWRKEKILGSGTFGIITLWKHLETNDYVAIKHCRFDQVMAGKSDRARDRWIQEVDVMKKLQHPNVVVSRPMPPGIERHLGSTLPPLAMEYCNGGDLRTVLYRPEYSTGLGEEQVVSILYQISSALLYLHMNRILHRDLKPENVMLQTDGDGNITYKLIDLGFCKELDQTSLANSFVGTLQYLAPELFVPGDYSSAVDNWSFGIVAFEVCTGSRPFLYNMHPPQWLPVVRKKKQEHIRATYDHETEENVYSSELPSFNHLNSCLKHDLERWLRVVLSYRPDKRGGQDAFQMVMQDILNKKVVHVYCINSLVQHSFPFTADTKMGQLQQLIEEVTKIDKNNQLMLIPAHDQGLKSLLCTGSAAIESTLVSSLVNERPNRKEYTIYLLNKTTPLIYDETTVASVIPSTLEKTLRDPTKMVTFEHQVRFCSQFLWVAQTLVNKFNHLLHANQKFTNYCVQMKQSVNDKYWDVKKDMAIMRKVIDTTKGRLTIYMNDLRDHPVSGSRSFVKEVMGVATRLMDSPNLPLKMKEIEDIGKPMKPEFPQCNLPEVDLMFDPLSPTMVSTNVSPKLQDMTALFSIYRSMVDLFDVTRKTPKEDRKRITEEAKSLSAFDMRPMIKQFCDLVQVIERLVKHQYSEVGHLISISSRLNRVSRLCKELSTEVAKKISEASEADVRLTNQVAQLIHDSRTGNGNNESVAQEVREIQDLLGLTFDQVSLNLRSLSMTNARNNTLSSYNSLQPLPSSEPRGSGATDPILQNKSESPLPF